MQLKSEGNEVSLIEYYNNKTRNISNIFEIMLYYIYFNTISESIRAHKFQPKNIVEKLFLKFL